MPEEVHTSLGIAVEKMERSQWSFGIGLSHWFNETYVFINIFKWMITIGMVGKIRKE